MHLHNQTMILTVPLLLNQLKNDISFILLIGDAKDTLKMLSLELKKNCSLNFSQINFCVHFLIIKGI